MEKKVTAGKLDEDSVSPTKFMNSELLSHNIKRFCEKMNVDSFIPRDFRRTFKTLGGQLKITNRFVTEFNTILYMMYHLSIMTDMIIMKKN